MSITKEQVSQLLGENNLSDDVLVNLRLMVESAITERVAEKQSIYKETIHNLTEEVERLKKIGESYGDYVKNGYDSKLNGLESNISEYSDYALSEHTKLTEQANAYGKYVEKTISEKAEAYGQYLSSEYEAEKQKLSEAAESYGEYVLESLTDEVDQYLDYVVSHFISENMEAMVESVDYRNMKSVFADIQETFSRHLFQLNPDNTVNDVKHKLGESITEHNKVLLEMANIKRKNSELNRKLVLEQTTRNLTDTQKEKIESLVENMRFSNDSEYKRGVELMIEEVVSPPTRTVAKANTNTNKRLINESNTETIIKMALFDEVNTTPTNNTGSEHDKMNRYINCFK